jgi:hypothetical protein
MSSSKLTLLLISTVSLVAISGCGGGNDSASIDTAAPVAAAPSKPAPNAGVTMSPGKMTAPVSISYQVVGNPVVGQPVAVNLLLTSSRDDQPVTLRYRANDASSMLFPDDQANAVQLSVGRNEAQRVQQVTVVPQREGRLYLNVSAEVQTDNGSMFRSLAVPIQVGSAPADLARNGELKETAEGEQVISMPAEESQ